MKLTDVQFVFFSWFSLICLLLQFDFFCYSICYVQSSYLCFVHSKKFTRSPLNYMPLILLVFSPYFGLVMMNFVPFLVFYYTWMIDMFSIVLDHSHVLFLLLHETMERFLRRKSQPSE